MANKTILSTIFNNQQLLLKITSGLNRKVDSKDEAIRLITTQLSTNIGYLSGVIDSISGAVDSVSGAIDGVSGAVSGMLADYYQVVPAIAESLVKFIQSQQDFNKDLSGVLTGFLPDTPVSTVLDNKVGAASTYISGVLGEWTPASGTVASRILDIEDEIRGGGGGGEGLGARVARLQTATKIETTSGTAIINSEDKLARKYQADIASMTCASFDYNKIKFYGNCQVDYGADGTIKIRIGEAVNCSLYNGTDGISKTTVTYGKASNPYSTTISNDFTNINTGSRGTVYKKNAISNFTANCGTTKTTKTEAGNSVHFENATSGAIRITYADGKGAADLHTINFALTSGCGSITSSGFTVGLTNWQTQPKSDTGANGCCVNINITWAPNTTFANTQTDFRLVKIEQLEGTSVVASWVNSDSNVYCHLTDTTTPGTPATASYTISTVNKKTIGGVTFLTNSSKISPSATGLTNLAYPATTSNKINCSPVGGTWFTGFNTNNTIVGLTDDKDVEMSWNTSGISILSGQYSNPQIAVKGMNFINNGTAKNSSETNNAILVCDANGYINNSHGSYSDSSRKDGASDTTYTSRDLSNNAAGSGDLQTYNGWIQYPNKDFTSFNKVTGDTNPDYSKCTGTRSAYLKVTKSGTIMGGTFTFTCSGNPETYFKNGSLKLEFVKEDGSNWRDVMNTAVGTSYKWGTTTQIGFTIDQPSDYGNGLLYIKFTMTGTTVGIGSFVLV